MVKRKLCERESCANRTVYESFKKDFFENKTKKMQIQKAIESLMILLSLTHNKPTSETPHSLPHTLTREGHIDSTQFLMKMMC